MKLDKLLEGIEDVQIIGNKNVDITNVNSDSRLIAENGLFVAIVGYVLDGTKFISSAIKNGAVAVMVEEGTDIESLDLPEDFAVIIVPKIRYAFAIACCNLHDNPSRKLKVIGVTGTKGKTTTTYMIKSLLEAHGLKVGLIGSIAIYIGDKKLEDTDRTSPEAFKYQEALDQMVKENVDVAILEVSSQGMKLDRVTGIDFDIAVFTNLSEEHISPKEHANMSEYFNCKLDLIKRAKIGITNSDNDYTSIIKCILRDQNIKTYGLHANSDLMAKNIEITNKYVTFDLNLYGKDEQIQVSLPGEFTVYNALAAISVAKEFGITSDEIKKALKNFSVLGRNELVPNKLGLTIIIDYAHTPSSLESILKATKSYAKGKVICTWGVGRRP